MNDPYQYPALRSPIDIRLESIENRSILLLSCPLGIATAPLALIGEIAPVLGCFEGKLSREEILNRFAGQGLRSELLQELISLLDSHRFLDTPAFAQAAKQARTEFQQLAARPAALAGSAYQATKRELTEEIDRYLHSSNAITPAQVSAPLLGLVAPHIDYRRGHLTYGAAYSRLRHEKNDLYILLGTSHQYSTHLFHLTNKIFETPLGHLPCDSTFVHSLSQRYGVERSYADEFLHRREHSLELQLPFLARLHGTPAIVPILVGGFHHMLVAGKYPENYEPYEAFATGLTSTLRDQLVHGRRICFIVGVDMAHVGRSFGDRDPLSSSVMEKVRARDERYLECIARADHHALFDHIAEDVDQRRICGFPSMYLLIDTLHRLGLRYRAELLEYRQAVDYPRECAVTFAGVGLYGMAD